jgi:uncharacterized membrane protein SpoIIM required for sporulation
VIDARESFRANIFREIFVTACWCIWLIRNGIIFDNERASINAWKRHFKTELGYVCTKAKPSQLGRINSNSGEIALYDILSYFLLGIDALYFYFV